MLDSNHTRVKPYLTTRGLQPENQETPIEFVGNEMMDQRLFYRRNHFSYPQFPFSSYWLQVNGTVNTPRLLSMHDILRLPSKTVKTVLECSGNKRSFFKPKVFGEQWGKGAISQAYWTGVPLWALLELAGIREAAQEVIVEGYDYGTRTDLDQIHAYARSLPLERAIHPDTIVAYQFNGEPIPFKHGYPLRLIVPEWYAMASVKWIKQITVHDSAFTGPFQTVDYVYYPHKDDDEDAKPVREMNVNSTIQHPQDMDQLNTGMQTIKGIAWTGKGSITKVEVSVDSGITWEAADLRSLDADGYSWTPWTFEWSVSVPGEYEIMSRATDSDNRQQPSVPFWNRKGYGYNAIDKIKVKIE